VVKSEQMLCTGRTGDLLQSITRGFDSDVAVGFSAGSYVSVYPVKKHWESLYAFLKAPEFDALTLEDVASNVNKVKIVNSATGQPLQIKPDTNAGSDTNIDLIVRAKGTGFTKIGERNIFLMCGGATTSMAVGDAVVFFAIPPQLNGMNLVSVRIGCITAGVTGTALVQIRNVTDSVDMLSTRCPLETTELNSDAVATPAVINTSYDDVVTNDVLAVDIDVIHTTPAKGLYVQLGFELP